MPIYIHIVTQLQHRIFIEQERKDPFTKQTIQAGDRVVFCAICKTAFLVNSWEAVGNKHCNQQNTLQTFPPQIEFLDIRKNISKSSILPASIPEPLSQSRVGNKLRVDKSGWKWLFLLLIIASLYEILSITKQPIIQQNNVQQQQTITIQTAKCHDGYLNTDQIKSLVTDRTAFGKRIDRRVPYDWKEYQSNNGTAYFQRVGHHYATTTGKWWIQGDSICWCYGDCAEGQCKRVLADNNCTTFSYVDITTGKTTGKIYRWEDGDKTN